MISEKQKKILAFPYSRFDAIICDGAVRSGKTSIMMWSFVEWAMREFNFQRFGQKKILAFPYSRFDAIICDGAVRSGKTSIMMWSFVEWAMREFNFQRFGICGKTVDSASKNIIAPFVAMTLAKRRYIMRWRRSEKVLEVRRGSVVNFFEIFGGKDEGSAALIQGRTLAGVLLDEVALMPRSFVEQALARCSVDGARLWFSCNPESPQHWFKREWIDQREKRNALYLHFEMRDNPSLSEKTLAQYESRYTGVFYDRYIRGLWVLAEGLVYDFFGEGQIVDDVPQSGRYYISCDYGTLNPFSAGLWCWDGKTATRIREYYYSGRSSQANKTDEGRYYISCDYGTLNPFSAGLWCWDGKTATRIREYYYSGRSSQANKTDEEYYTELEKLADGLPIENIVVDPSAASFIETIRRHGQWTVRKAANDVIPGIVTTSRLLKNGTVKIHRGCVNTIREFGLYRWDEKSAEDKVIKEHDHAMDDTRYFCHTILRRKVDAQDYVPLGMR